MRSYGVLQYNLGKPLNEAWDWLFSESVFREITGPADLACYRHHGSVNCFFKDGHVELVPRDEVRFP